MSFHYELVGDRAELATLRADTVLEGKTKEGGRERSKSQRTRFRRFLRSMREQVQRRRGIIRFPKFARSACELQLTRWRTFESSLNFKAQELELDLSSAQPLLQTQESFLLNVTHLPKPDSSKPSLATKEKDDNEARRKEEERKEGRKESASSPCARSPHPHTSDCREG